jgi:hypothetical protein
MESQNGPLPKVSDTRLGRLLPGLMSHAGPAQSRDPAHGECSHRLAYFSVLPGPQGRATFQTTKARSAKVDSYAARIE